MYSKKAHPNSTKVYRKYSKSIPKSTKKVHQSLQKLYQHLYSSNRILKQTKCTLFLCFFFLFSHTPNIYTYYFTTHFLLLISPFSYISLYFHTHFFYTFIHQTTFSTLFYTHHPTFSYTFLYFPNTFSTFP